MPRMIEGHDDEGFFDLQGQSYGEIKNAPNTIGVDRPSLWIDTHNGRPMMTTGYGLNEPQWTVGGPPPLIFHLSPYARVPLPPMFRIHPVLSFSETANLNWTIDQPPHYASPAPGLVHLDPYHWKSNPATEPATSTPLIIFVESMRCYITVTPTRNVVTIGDVLAAVYTGVRRHATETLLSRVGLDIRMMGAMSHFGRGITQHRGPPMGDDEVSSNVRSSTNFCTKWAGLTPSRKEEDVWCLHTRSLAG